MPVRAPPAVRQEGVVDLHREVVALIAEVDATGHPGDEPVADLVEPLLAAVEVGGDDEFLAGVVAVDTCDRSAAPPEAVAFSSGVNVEPAGSVGEAATGKPKTSCRRGRSRRRRTNR